jgi:hypothetical protein
MSIRVNAAKCAHCGEVIISTHRHDFVVHMCKTGPLRDRKVWNKDMTKLIIDGVERPSFAVDGGQDYLRRVGEHEDWIEASIWD